ncbi:MULTISPECIES: type II toxin-antitoxin system ParD family antitoxin [unclassified Sinorhizobium]|uniref:type II toxin-antitoxin system ParD family antitoxin n=1 Tax=unclassified Sinorhizobium TaxID=2613772 RepID=UPI003523B7D0
MTKNTSIVLGDHFSGFVERQIVEGRYGSASEVIRAGLRLLEEHEAKVKALRDAIAAGIESGHADDFDFDEFLDRKRRTRAK